MKPFRHLAALVAALAFSPVLLAQGQVPPGTSIGNVSHAHATSGVVTVAEASDFTAVADVAGSLGGTTFRFYNAGDAVCYQPWYDVDNGSTAPAAVGSCVLVEVDIAADDTDATVAGNTRTVLNAAPYTTYFAITGATTHVIVTSLTKGAATDGNIGDTGFSISKTQGVSGTLAIASASVLPDLLGWRICNDDVQTSTWLAVGESTLDPETDGVRLAKGDCHECLNCSGAALRSIYVSSQAASGAYSVTQFKK